MTDPMTPFTVAIDVVIRRCREHDLEALEWWGLFAADRGLIRGIYERQEHGEAVMLVADAKGMASGQAWLDLSRRKRDRTGVIWAVRVFPCLQGLGIGTRLMAAAEGVLRERGFLTAEVTVERGSSARAFYERLGYREVEIAGPMAALAPPGSPKAVEGSQVLLRKPLGFSCHAAWGTEV